MKKIVVLAVCALISTMLNGQTTVLINNVQIFDGVQEKLVTGNVLIQGDTIARITSSPISGNRSAATTIIDGKGKLLMPGLIDAHWHTIRLAKQYKIKTAGGDQGRRLCRSAAGGRQSPPKHPTGG